MSDLVSKHGEIITGNIRSTISQRYHTIAKAINKEFWNSTSDTANSLYVGSYGRGTAVDTSDLDVLVCLPESEYKRHDIMKGNGQSRLLQSVRNAILISYPRSNVRADGQVVKINFTDGMKFEILPAFKEFDWYGNWKSTNPKAEQDAMKSKNRTSNGLLFDTCKHIRSIRDNHFSSYHLSGIVIDSFVYEAIGNWKWSEPGSSSSSPSGTYEQVLLDYYNKYIAWGFPIKAPGSNDSVSSDTSIECLKKVLDYMVK